MDHLVALPVRPRRAPDARIPRRMIGLKRPRHPDDAGNIALPWARFVSVSRKIAHIVNFFPVIRQEYNDGVFSLETQKDSIDNGIIIEYGANV